MSEAGGAPIRYRRWFSLAAAWAAWLALTVAVLARAVSWSAWGILALLVVAAGLLAAAVLHLLRPLRAVTFSPEGVRGVWHLLP